MSKRIKHKISELLHDFGEPNFGVEHGEVIVSYGEDIIEIEIPKYREIIEFYVSLSERRDSCGCNQVCGGDINKVGYSICGHDVILYLSIKSDSCKVKWFYEYRKTHHHRG